MLNINKLSIIISVSLGLCAASFAEDKVTAHADDSYLNGTIQSINGELSSQRAEIGALKAEIKAINHDNYSGKQQILEELKALRRQNQALADSMFDNPIKKKNEDGTVMEVKPLRNYDMQTPDGKYIFGGDEFFYVKEANATFAARVDTGAAYSSISASNITNFERNGKKWVRFDIIANERTVTVEAPFVRNTRVVQSAADDFDYRPVVKLQVKIADYSTSSEFNLVDRTKMQYALLIGRSLLQDIAVVDVSRRYIQPRADKDGLVFLKIDDYEDAKKKGINPNEKYDSEQKDQVAGMKAYPSKEYGSSLGADANNALPEVVAAKNQNLPQENLKSKADGSTDKTDTAAQPKSDSKSQTSPKDSTDSDKKSKEQK